MMTVMEIDKEGDIKLSKDLMANTLMMMIFGVNILKVYLAKDSEEKEKMLLKFEEEIPKIKKEE